MSSDATIISPGALVGAGPVPAVRVAQRSRAGVAIAGLSLLVIVVVSLLVVVLAANRPSFLAPTTHGGYFPGWLAGPLGGLWPSFTSGSNALKYIFTFGLVAMYVAYVLALSHVRHLRAGWVIAAVVAAHVVLVLSPPLSLTDVFNYVNYGRMEIVHHLNPYATIPYYEPHSDPSFDLSNWHHLLSPYGPLFTVLTFALVPLGVAGSFWALKLVLMLASLGTVALVWACARQLGRDPRAAIVFVGLNPLVLLWGLGGDHNDFLMMVLIVGAFYLLLRARALTKPVQDAGQVAGGALAAPVTVPGPLTVAGIRRRAALLRGREHGGAPVAAIGNLVAPVSAGANGSRTWPFAGLRARPRGAGLRNLVWPPAPLDVAAGALLITAVAIKASAAILLPVVLMALLVRPRDLVQVLIGVVGAGVVLAATTYIAFGLHIPDLSTQARLVTPVSVPNLVGLALGQGGETRAVRAVMTALLVAGVLASAWWASRHRELGADALVTGAGWASVVLVLTLSWVLPWYVLWMLPLAILSHSRALRTTVLVVGVYLIFAWMPLQADLFKAIHFKPLGTSLGQLDQRETKLLLH